MGMVSVIVPAYNEELMIHKAADTFAQLFQNHFEYEILFVDDGSTDQTWKCITQIAEQTDRVSGIHFSRNFGKESAIMAGLEASAGDCCVVIDCDLQHPPEKILEMYQLWEQGYEVIEGRKASRGTESRVHSAAAHIFYTVISKAVGIDLENASDFKMLDRKAVNVLLNMREKNAFFRALSSWIGFETATVSFDVQERSAGKSKWSTKSLVKYAIRNVCSFSAAPMQLVTLFGVIMLVISLVLGVTSLVQKIIGVAFPGFTTVILILLFSSSIIMISLGIIGYYISQIYEEIKGRPKYIISKKCGRRANKKDDEF